MGPGLGAGGGLGGGDGGGPGLCDAAGVAAGDGEEAEGHTCGQSARAATNPGHVYSAEPLYRQPPMGRGHQWQGALSPLYPAHSQHVALGAYGAMPHGVTARSPA